MCLLRDLHFALLYVVVFPQFDKHLHLTRCLNAHNHNACIHLPKNRLYCAKDDILHYKLRSPNELVLDTSNKEFKINLL